METRTCFRVGSAAESRPRLGRLLVFLAVTGVHTHPSLRSGDEPGRRERREQNVPFWRFPC